MDRQENSHFIKIPVFISLETTVQTPDCHPTFQSSWLHPALITLAMPHLPLAPPQTHKSSNV
jgi:hypothetical protein